MGPARGGESDKSLRSMTGFGRSRRSLDDVEMVAEIRSVNHRFLDVSVKLPKMYSSFEPEIRKIISAAVQRGKIDVSVSRSGGRGGLVEVTLDARLAGSYYDALVSLKERLNLAGEITVSDMLTLNDIIVPVEKEDALEKEWPEVRAGIEEALAALDEMRRTEGAALWDDMAPRLNSIRERAEVIAGSAEQVVAAAKERLEKRVQDLTGGMELDENRLLQEVAVIADRCDVTEELTRLKSHVEQFFAIAAEGSPLGRKLDFLLQELNREVNTIGSKSASAGVAVHVVDVKAELEKIREQIQNIE